MVVIRGHKLDYDTWAELGSEGWSYNDVLPFFKKSEDMQDPTLAQSGNSFVSLVGYMTLE